MRRAAAAALLALVVLTGCEKVTRSVGSSVSPCYRALPQAHQAVGGQGTFVDVTRIRGQRVLEFPRFRQAVEPAPTSTTVPGESRDICVVVFKGTFDPARIPLLSTLTPSGRYAIVVIPVRKLEVRRVFLTDRLPVGLHAH